MTLTNRYMYFDGLNNGLTTGAYGKSLKSIETLVSSLGFEDTILTAYPYNNSIPIVGKYVDSTYQQFSYRATHALSSIANKLSTEELFDILSPNSINVTNQYGQFSVDINNSDRFANKIYK
ncbi:MAG: hypothetical protein IH948_00565 [Bacteroidetes bacterium]|nr:hypothetical protein [Bacteroidota bacterium]